MENHIIKKQTTITHQQNAYRRITNRKRTRQSSKSATNQETPHHTYNLRHHVNRDALTKTSSVPVSASNQAERMNIAFPKRRVNFDEHPKFISFHHVTLSVNSLESVLLPLMGEYRFHSSWAQEKWKRNKYCSLTSLSFHDIVKREIYF